MGIYLINYHVVSGYSRCGPCLLGVRGERCIHVPRLLKHTAIRRAGFYMTCRQVRRCMALTGCPRGISRTPMSQQPVTSARAGWCDMCLGQDTTTCTFILTETSKIHARSSPLPEPEYGHRAPAAPGLGQ